MIDINKKYKTRSGLPVRILCVDRKSEEFPVVALVTNKDGHEVASTFTKTGSYHIEDVSMNDLIEVSPYEDFKVDDLCVVSATEGKYKTFRYFAKEVQGIPYCFDDGKTSFTFNNEYFTAWDKCRKATPEEIATKTIKD